jgi:hypothetical protein
MRGAKNGRAKLTDVQVAAIRSMWKEGGWTKRALGQVFGVTDAMVARIITRKAWSHIP